MAVVKLIDEMTLRSIIKQGHGLSLNATTVGGRLPLTCST
jgi:hypothetical protein